MEIIIGSFIGGAIGLAALWIKAYEAFDRWRMRRYWREAEERRQDLLAAHDPHLKAVIENHRRRAKRKSRLD